MNLTKYYLTKYNLKYDKNNPVNLINNAQKKVLVPLDDTALD